MARQLVRLLREHAAIVGLAELALAKERGLSSAEVRCLAEFAGAPELTVRELTRRLGFCHSRFSRILESLEGRALISRRIHEDDRRLIIVTLTPGGSEVVTQLEDELGRRYESMRLAPRAATATAVRVLARALADARPAHQEPGAEAT